MYLCTCLVLLSVKVLRDTQLSRETQAIKPPVPLLLFAALLLARSLVILGPSSQAVGFEIHQALPRKRRQTFDQSSRSAAPIHQRPVGQPASQPSHLTTETLPTTRDPSPRNSRQTLTLGSIPRYRSLARLQSTARSRERQSSQR